MKIFHKKAIIDFKKFGWRTILMIGVIILSLGGSLAFIYVNIAAPMWMDNYFDSVNHADYTYQLADDTWITEDQLEEIEDVKGVKDYTGRLFYKTFLKLPEQEEVKYILFVGLDESNNYPDVFNYTITEGENFNDNNNNLSVVIDKTFADKNKIDIKDTLEIDGLSDAEIKITGFCSSPEFLMMSSNPEYTIPIKGSIAVCYLSKDTLKNYIVQYLTDIGQSLLANYYSTVDYNNIAVTFKEEENQLEVNDDVEDFFEDDLGLNVEKAEKFEEMASYDRFKSDINKANQFTRILLFFMAIMGVVITYVIFNRYVFSQQQQIGILQSFGYDNKSTNRYFFIIFTLITSITIPLSLILGYVMGWMILGVMLSRIANLTLMEIQFLFLPEIIFIGLVFGPVLIFLSIFLPIRAIKKHVIADLIYQQKQIKEKKGIKERKVSSLKKISHTYVNRNLFRYKGRIVFTTIAMTFSLLIISATQTLLDSMNYNVSRIFKSETNPDANEIWDLNVNFQNSVNLSLSDNPYEQLKDLDDVEEIEKYAKGLITAEGEDKQTFLLIGYNLMDTKMHKFTWEGSEEENEIPESKYEIILSYVHAVKLEKNIGDNLEIKNAAGEEFTLKIVGIHRELILVGYITLRTAQLIFHEGENLINGAYILVDASAKKDDVKDNIYDIDNIEVVFDSEEMGEKIMEYYTDFFPLMSMVVYYCLVVSFFIVFYNAVMNIYDKNYEYGIFRSLGYSKKKNFILITKENFLQGIIPIILALIFTYPLSLQLASIFQTDSPFRVVIGLNAIMYIIVPPIILNFIGSIIALKTIYRKDLYEQVQTRFIG